jgi:hypothetical protein
MKRAKNRQVACQDAAGDRDAPEVMRSRNVVHEWPMSPGWRTAAMVLSPAGRPPHRNGTIRRNLLVAAGSGESPLTEP